MSFEQSDSFGPSYHLHQDHMHHTHHSHHWGHKHHSRHNHHQRHNAHSHHQHHGPNLRHTIHDPHQFQTSHNPHHHRTALQRHNSHSLSHRHLSHNSQSDDDLEIDVVDITAHASPHHHTLHYHQASLTTHYHHSPHISQHQQAPPTSHEVPTSHTSLSNNGLSQTMKKDHMTAVGMLTPALALVPEIREAEYFTEQYPELRGEEGDLILAAAHIDDARTGRGRYGKAKYYFKQRPAQVAFKVITNKWFQRLIYAAILLHSVLTFIEPPSVSPQSVETYIALGLNLLCISVYLLDIILNTIFLSWRGFWTYEEQNWNRVQFVFLCFFTIDWILLLAQIASGNNDIVQPFRCLRLAMIVCKAKNVGHITNVVKSITIKLGGVLFIVLVFIVLYSCIGVHLVMEPFIEISEVNISEFRPPEVEEVSTEMSGNQTIVVVETCSSSTVNDTNIYEGTFNHVGTAVYQLFVLLTTENYPVFMFPAYSHSEWYFVYFGTFLFLGVFFITSILLAIIADLYWKYNKKHVKKERAKQRAELVKAWKILDVMGIEKMPVDDPKFLKLFRLLKPENTDAENEHLIAELDPEQTGWVDWIYWVTQLLSILDLEKTTLNTNKKVYSGPACVLVMSKVAGKITAWGGFDKVVLFLIISHSVLFGLKWVRMSLTATLIIQGLRTSIVTAFILEMTIRLASSGRQFFKNIINSLDLALVTVALLCNVLWYAILSPTMEGKVSPFLWRGSFVVTSSLAVFFRLFLNSEQSRQVMTVFFRLVPVMLDLIILFGIVLYFYGVLGMESFHSFMITSNTPDSNYLQYGCGLGFTNFKCSLFILFQILTTSNWHEIMNTVIVSLNSFAPVIYFIPCYIVINFIIMNLLVAIGIEAFNKFSQEQKDEGKEAESQTTSPAYPESDKRTMKEGCTYFGRRLLSSVKSFAGAALSSARVTEEDPRNSSVIHIQSQPLGDHMTQSRPNSDHITQSRPNSDHMTQSRTNSDQTLNSSGYSTSSMSFCRSSVSSDTGVNDFQSSLILHNPTTEVQDVEDSEYEHQPSNQINSPPTTTAPLNRQDKIKHLLKERQKQLRMKRPANAVVAAVGLQSNLPNSSGEQVEPRGVTVEHSNLRLQSGSEVISEGVGDGCKQSENPQEGGGSTPSRRLSKKWGAAAQAFNFVRQLDSEAEQNEATDQFDEDIRRIGKPRVDLLSTGPKFRRGYNKGNWRSEVQNITIINKEEIHELRKQLAAKPSIIKKQRFRQSSVDSSLSDSSESGYHGYMHHRSSTLERQKRMLKDFSQQSVDSTLTLNQLSVDLHDTIQEQPGSYSPIDNFLSHSKQTSISSTDSDNQYLQLRSSLPSDLERPFDYPSGPQNSPRNSLKLHDHSKSPATSTTSSSDSPPVYRSATENQSAFPTGDKDQLMSPPKDEPSGDVGGTSSQTLNTPSEDLPKNKNLKMEFGGCDREVHRPESLACSHQDGSPELVNETPEVEQFDKTGEIRRSREFFKTPLISVDEVVEPLESPMSDTRPESHKLKVPGVSQSKSKSASRDSGGERVNKEMPDWVKKLTDKYNLTIHTDTQSED